MSVFFSSTFHNIFTAQQRIVSEQGQFTTNEVLRDKLIDAESIIEPASPSNSDFVVLKKDTEGGKMPFTYIGLDADDKIVSKDFFVFNGMIGSSTSTSYYANNPGGIVQVDTDYYVTAPLEDKIYLCTAPSTCPSSLSDDLIVHPTDVTADSDENLYVTSSGNNTIVKITDPSGSPSYETLPITGLNFPTGIAYYKDTSSNEYLFVADTYNNLVKKIDLTDNSVSTVVGLGDDSTCNSTAKYCKLDFPTGLYLSGTDLYIADTGNGRVLKMSDPGYPSDPIISFSSPETDEEIREIKFIFPTGTNTGTTTTSGIDNLNPNGTFSSSNEELTYELWTQLSEGTNDTNDCIADTGEPDYDCTDWAKEKIRVNNADLFDNSTYNLIDLIDPTTPVTITGDEGGGVFSTNGFTNGHASGTEVKLMTPVSADSEITFEFSDLDTTGVSVGYQELSIEMYDEDENLLEEARTSTLTIGDGILGTSEDIIEALPDSYNYPTGLSWSGSPGSLQVAGNAVYDETQFPSYDYTSDFTVGDLSISAYNGDTILELSVVDAVIDDENTESYTLTSSL